VGCSKEELVSELESLARGLRALVAAGAEGTEPPSGAAEVRVDVVHFLYLR
jgi:hypothetical protein